MIIEYQHILNFIHDQCPRLYTSLGVPLDLEAPNAWDIKIAVLKDASFTQHLQNLQNRIVKFSDGAHEAEKSAAETLRTSLSQERVNFLESTLPLAEAKQELRAKCLVSIQVAEQSVLVNHRGIPSLFKLIKNALKALGTRVYTGQWGLFKVKTESHEDLSKINVDIERVIPRNEGG